MARRLILAISLLCVAATVRVFPLLQKVYKQHVAMAEWESIPVRVRRPGKMVLRSGDPRGHTQQFWAVMHAYGLNEGDHPVKFIAVFGAPDSQGPHYSGTTSYRWNRDRYLWPTPNSNAMFPTTLNERGVPTLNEP